MGAPIDRRSLLRLAGAAGIGGVAIASGLAAPGVVPPAGANVPGGFVPMSPYRSFDSRPRRIETGQKIDVDLGKDTKGAQQLPEIVSAVAYNLTIADTAGSGFLALLPSGNDWEGNSSINWWAGGLLLANGGIISVANALELQTVTVLCGGGGLTAFIIDVTGYFL